MIQTSDCQVSRYCTSSFLTHWDAKQRVNQLRHRTTSDATEVAVQPVELGFPACADLTTPLRRHLVQLSLEALEVVVGEAFRIL